MKRIRGEVSNIFDPQKQQYPITNSNGENSVQFPDWHTVLNNECLLRIKYYYVCANLGTGSLKDICRFLDGNLDMLVTLKI